MSKLFLQNIQLNIDSPTMAKNMQPQFKIKIQSSQQGLYLKYLQNTSSFLQSQEQITKPHPSVVIVRISPLSQTNISQSQSGLLLDFAIRDSVQEQKTWSAFQHKLKQIFNSIVVCSMLPNCQLKINLFIVIGGQDIQATIINSVFLGLVKMGIPVHYCTYCYLDENSSKTNKKGSNILFNIGSNDEKNKYEVVYGKYQENLQEKEHKFSSQIESYKKIMIQAINEEIR